MQITSPADGAAETFDYVREERRRRGFLAAAVLVALALCLLDVAAGEMWISPAEMLHTLLSPETAARADRIILTDIRLPRAATALLAGIALGFSGGIMQTVLSNKLASPYTLGLSSAAGLGASIAITTGIGAAGIGVYLIPAVSFLATALACYLIFLFGKYFNAKPDTMILGGIGLSFIFQALQSLFQYAATTEQSQNIVFWLFGSLARASWISTGITAAALLLFIPYIVRDAWKLTALRLGDETAAGLGIEVKWLRGRALLAVSFMTGVAVSFIGTIGFIGLVGPHIARLAVGEDQRYYLPASGVCGGILLSLASVVSKTVVPGTIFPIGIITAVVGGPFFLCFLFAKRKSVIGDGDD